ncbi:MAG: group 1 truncated hemoglobin [Chitinophagaceae bacterium]
MKKLSLLLITTLIASCAFMLSCKKDNAAPAKPTLYDSLGGTAMVTDPTSTSVKIESGRLLIRNIVDSSIFVIAGDTRINGHFTVLLAEVTAGNLSGFSALSKNLTDFVCVGTGAKNFTYGGKSMAAAHDPAQNSRMNGKATNADMDAFEEDLVQGAGQAGVQATNPALASVAKIVESLRSVVVQQ